MKHLTPTKLTLALVTALSLTACSSIEPRPFTEQALAEQGRADLNTAQADVEPIVGALSLDQALARAL